MERFTINARGCAGNNNAEAPEQLQDSDRFHHFVDEMHTAAAASQPPYDQSRMTMMEGHEMMMLFSRRSLNATCSVASMGSKSGNGDIYVEDHNRQQNQLKQAMNMQQLQRSDAEVCYSNCMETKESGHCRSSGVQICGGGSEEKERSSAAAAEGRSSSVAAVGRSRYECQKRRDWNTFGQYIRNMVPGEAMPMTKCNGDHVLQFLRYLDQFGKTRIHMAGCPNFGRPDAPPAGSSTCGCPLRQAWGSLDALIGRLRAAFEENVGGASDNPFAAKVVRVYLRQVRDSQAKARGISNQKKPRKRAAAQLVSAAAPPLLTASTAIRSSSSTSSRSLRQV